MKPYMKSAQIWNLIAVFLSVLTPCLSVPGWLSVVSSSFTYGRSWAPSYQTSYADIYPSTYQLYAPAEYVAFTGDLSIQFAIPSHVSIPDAFIRLVLITDKQPEEITTLHSIDSERKSGTRKIQCGIIEIAGNYEIQLHMYLGGPILARSSVIVRWPNVVMQLPENHKAQSSSVHLKLSSPAACNPLLRRYSFQVNLEYASNTSGIAIAGREELLYSIPFSNFSTSDLVLEFPCSLFDLTGIYRASLVSSFSAISIVSRSNILINELNPAYKLNIWAQTIFPCSGILQVDYIQPQCPGDKEHNRVRIFMLRPKYSGSLASPLLKSYIKERSADPDRNTLFFNCSDFKTAASGYCFQYVTIARNDAIINQTELCLSAHPDSVLPIDGGWSQWSQWSACSASCGSGKQNRHRMCNSPTPNYGGAFCAGSPMQSKNCESFCPESIPRTPLHSPTVDHQCACGCEINSDSGEIIASGRCERISRWLIIAPENHKIKLSFTYMDFYQNKQWVKVRDGKFKDSDLIAFSDGRKDITHVTSTANEMLVEFWSEPRENSDWVANDGDRPMPYIYPMAATRPIHVHGFIATFSSNETTAGMFAVSAQPVRNIEKPSIWQSTVTIVGISLCGLVVITALSFVIYHRACHKRLHKYAMAAHEESPKRMCKSTSMHSTPSRDSHPGIEIEHDMEIPLTGHITGEKKKAKTPGSTKSRASISSACSHNVKKLKTKADIEYNSGSRRPSPLTPKGDYSPIPQYSSPRKHSRTHEVTQDSEPMSLFRTSPLLKTKVPRSPKVHPSPKFSKHRSQPSPSEGVHKKHTKSDMLSKRFDQKRPGSERVVMGSDHTPTGSVVSPPSESYKTECETPTNINFDMSKVCRRSANNADTSTLSQQDDITLQDMDKTEDNDRKPASGTSDESTSAEKSPGSQMTTSFIENSGKARRPTSLTESYSKMSISSLMARMNNGDSSKPNTECNGKDSGSVTSSDDRQRVLPKPDGQSPKSPRVEHAKKSPHTISPAKTSKGSTPKSVHSLKSDQTGTSSKTASPARSVNTPSDTIELEYDDFIDMDDTYSYFDPIETEKLTWHGVEKVKAKTPKSEEK